MFTAIGAPIVPVPSTATFISAAGVLLDRGRDLWRREARVKGGGRRVLARTEAQCRGVAGPWLDDRAHRVQQVRRAVLAPRGVVRAHRDAPGLDGGLQERGLVAEAEGPLGRFLGLAPECPARLLQNVDVLLLVAAELGGELLQAPLELGVLQRRLVERGLELLEPVGEVE